MSTFIAMYLQAYVLLLARLSGNCLSDFKFLLTRGTDPDNITLQIGGNWFGDNVWEDKMKNRMNACNSAV